MNKNVTRSILFLALTAGQPLFAATVAVLPGSGGFQNSNYGGNITLGWGFSLSQPVTVTDLGYFDGNSGLTDSHPVGIWDSLGSLIAQATVPSGTAGDLVSGFRFAAIAPVVLGAGSYTIGGYADGTSADEFRFNVPSITTITGLSFGPTHLYTQGDSLSEPLTKADVFSQDGYFGPNFEVSSSVASTPEPESIEMSLLGLAIVTGLRVWRARRVG
jgi:hypothetical protein